MKEYKINLHAHTVFSDGKNTPVEMARKARELGFSALVLTDHYYNGEHHEVGLVKEKMTSYRKSVKEARSIIPVIVGFEVPYRGEEVLVFGGSALAQIEADNGIIDLAELRKKHNCGVILCHPNVNYLNFLGTVDGYERYNAGSDMFANGRPLMDLPQWCNSDAHSAEMLSFGWNVIDTKIENESDLITYIKKGKHPTPWIKEWGSEDNVHKYQGGIND